MTIIGVFRYQRVNEIDVIGTGCEKLVLSQLYQNTMHFWVYNKGCY